MARGKGRCEGKLSNHFKLKRKNMAWFRKHCEKCGKEVDKNNAPQRFGKYFCSEEHAEEYTKVKEEQMRQAPKQRSGGGCCG